MLTLILILIVICAIMCILGMAYCNEWLFGIGIIVGFNIIILGLFIYAPLNTKYIKYVVPGRVEYCKTSNTLLVEATDKDGEIIRLITQNVNLYNTVNKSTKFYIKENYNHYNNLINSEITTNNYFQKD